MPRRSVLACKRRVFCCCSGGFFWLAVLVFPISKRVRPPPHTSVSSPTTGSTLQPHILQFVTPQPFFISDSLSPLQSFPQSHFGRLSSWPDKLLLAPNTYHWRKVITTNGLISFWCPPLAAERRHRLFFFLMQWGGESTSAHSAEKADTRSCKACPRSKQTEPREIFIWGLGLDDLSRSLSIPNVLWFCDF